MKPNPPTQLRIGPWRIDPDGLTVQSGDRRSQLQGRSMELLVLLHQADGAVVSKDRISEAIWGQDGASDELIARHVSMIRQALGEDARAPRWLETVPRVGYRLVQDHPSGWLNWTRVAAAAALVAAVVLIRLAGDPDPAASESRRLESGRALLDPGPFRGDLAVAPEGGLLAWVEGGNVDVAGTLVVHDPATGTTDTIADGLNRFPSFSPDGSRLAYFQGDDPRGCHLVVVDRDSDGALGRWPCGGTVSSPVAWEDRNQVLMAVDPVAGRGARLVRLDLISGETGIAWRPDDQQIIRFPRRLADGLIAAVIREGPADTLVEISLADGHLKRRYGDLRTRIRWLDISTDGRRMLLVRNDPSDRFVLYEVDRLDGSVRLLGNRDAVQSATYRSDGQGVLYAAVLYRRDHRIYRRGPDGIYRHQRLAVEHPSTPAVQLAPGGQRVLFLADSDAGVGVFRMDVPEGNHQRLLTAGTDQRPGHPAWSADGSRMAVALNGEAGTIALLDADGSIRRYPVPAFMGPLRFIDNHLAMIELHPGRLSAYRLDLDSGEVERVVEVDGQWGQFGADGTLYVVAADFVLSAVRFTAGGVDHRALTHVGSTSGWTVAGRTLFYACPGEPTRSATLCEMNLETGAVVPHPEVGFYPSRLSASADGQALAVVRLEDLRLELLSARWSQEETLASAP